MTVATRSPCGPLCIDTAGVEDFLKTFSVNLFWKFSRRFRFRSCRLDFPHRRNRPPSTNPTQSCLLTFPRPRQVAAGFRTPSRWLELTAVTPLTESLATIQDTEVSTCRTAVPASILTLAPVRRSPLTLAPRASPDTSNALSAIPFLWLPKTVRLEQAALTSLLEGNRKTVRFSRLPPTWLRRPQASLRRHRHGSFHAFVYVWTAVFKKRIYKFEAFYSFFHRNELLETGTRLFFSSESRLAFWRYSIVQRKTDWPAAASR